MASAATEAQTQKRRFSAHLYLYACDEIRYRAREGAPVAKAEPEDFAERDALAACWLDRLASWAEIHNKYGCGMLAGLHGEQKIARWRAYAEWLRARGEA
jgi:hypothetical protein